MDRSSSKRLSADLRAARARLDRCGVVGTLVGILVGSEPLTVLFRSTSPYHGRGVGEGGFRFRSGYRKSGIKQQVDVFARSAAIPARQPNRDHYPVSALRRQGDTRA